MKLRNTIGKNLSFAAVILLAAFAASAQTTAFSYQGRLTDAGSPGNGSFQMQFKLFDAASGGTQIGTTLSDVPITAAQGNFSLKLDFGASVFTGADRWVEVAVRRNSGESYTTLSPREQIASSPYSLRTLSAAQADDAQKLGGVNASEYVTTTNPASDGFIKNQTVQQAASNFNVSGNGTVGSLTSGGAVSIGGTAAPGTAPTGQGRLYFDSGANKFKISENGAAFVNLVGASGVSGSGAVGRLPFWSAATTLSDSVLAQSGSFIGIGTQMPNSALEIRGTSFGVQQRLTDTATGNSLVLQGGAGSTMKIGGFNYTTGVAQRLFISPDGANTIMNINGGSVGIGVNSPAVFGLHIGSGVNGGQAQLRLDNSNGTFGGLNRWTNRLELMSSDAIGLSGPGGGMWIDTNGNVGIGTLGPTQKLDVAGTTKTNILQITGGSDLAEKFEIVDHVKPGMIVAIDPKNAGKLVLARGIYNRQVAGVISGANNLSAGMLLPDLEEGKNSLPVALSGRVWVYADATRNPIRPGDLLTTSLSPGHAMKVTNHRRSNGAIIGKAMSELKAGTGLVLVLVSLQ